MVTIYKNAYSTDFRHITLEDALRRIKSGKSLEAVKTIRDCKTKEEADELKKRLPCVCFGGKFGPKHTDAELTEHSGFIPLDFDHVDVEKKKAELKADTFIYSCWTSPSGTGVKALVKIADGSRHKQHFDALKERYPDLDPSGRNPSRLCFESYDPDLYLNPNSEIWTKTVQITQEHIAHTSDEEEIFNKLLKWMANKGRVFQSGERNHFIFIIASACCKYGIPEDKAVSLISIYVSTDSDFSAKEAKATIRSAYRKNRSLFNSVEFDNGRFIDKKTRKDVEVKLSHEDVKELNKQHVIYGSDVAEEVLDLWENGYKQVAGINVPEIDRYYKRKPGELTCVSGYGNMGKSAYWMWYYVMRGIIFDERVAIFGPESGTPQDFYFELIEIYLGKACHKGSPDRPPKEELQAAFEWVTDHFFYVEPSEVAPTPEVIKEAFLGLIIGRGVKSVLIDPFNQLSNDYGGAGGRSDKYLETFLSDCSRFAKQNMVNFDIIAHPRTPRDKDAKGDYPCPDQFSIADGTMWNNKCDNILIYHRPSGMSDPMNGACEVHSKKIKRQRIVGEKGSVEMYYMRAKRRFFVDGRDVMEEAKGGVVKKVEIRPNLNFFEPKYEHPSYNDPLNPDSPF